MAHPRETEGEEEGRLNLWPDTSICPISKPPSVKTSSIKLIFYKMDIASVTMEGELTRDDEASLLAARCVV
jgi:hypothetical protein